MPGVNRFIYGDEGMGGFYGFDDMIGALQYRAEQMQVITYPGEDGESLRKTGIRAPNSTVVTQLYVDDEEDAALLLTNDYLPLIDGNSLQVRQYGEYLGYFRILAIEQLPMQPVTAVRGHIGGGTPTILQTLRWTIKHTDIVPP